MTDYERYQLEWMIDHGHSLGELMGELTGLQNNLEGTPGVNLTVREVFEAWEADRGFSGEVFAGLSPSVPPIPRREERHG